MKMKLRKVVGSTNIEYLCFPWVLFEGQSQRPEHFMFQRFSSCAMIHGIIPFSFLTARTLGEN